ncbi:MAG: class II fumarate hydratase [Candidatus Helarchaeota archaeon]
MRIEKDFLGAIEVPDEAYWGSNTQRAIQNFKISGMTFPLSFILAIIKVKKACLQANFELENIDKEKFDAIFQAINEILIDNKYLDQFPLDIYQTGSGTQINMNVNEVIANRANEILGYSLGKKFPVHPNDHVNKSQSSNDVIPTAMHIATLEQLDSNLFPVLNELINVLNMKITEFNDIIKVGRTHLQDAVPIPISTEFKVYKRQIEISKKNLENIYDQLLYIPISGTAVGTGINADKSFGDKVIKYLVKLDNRPYKINPVKAENIASHLILVNISSALRLLAIALLKMANDIRWMGSGPRAGLGELVLPQNEPGSSIMPGKVNPTQSEALIQVCLKVIGNDLTISLGELYGSNLDLNVCKPLIITNLLESIKILSGGIKSFTKNCLKELKVNEKVCSKNLENILMLVTNLVPIIGYDKASEIASIAYKTGKTIKEVVLDLKLEIKENLDELLDPKKMV